MKKSIIIAGMIAFVAVSCSKKYTCECDVFGTKVSTEAEFKKKADAQAWCEDGSGGLCELK